MVTTCDGFAYHQGNPDWDPFSATADHAYGTCLPEGYEPHYGIQSAPFHLEMAKTMAFEPVEPSFNLPRNQIERGPWKDNGIQPSEPMDIPWNTVTAEVDTPGTALLAANEIRSTLATTASNVQENTMWLQSKGNECNYCHETFRRLCDLK